MEVADLVIAFRAKSQHAVRPLGAGGFSLIPTHSPTAERIGDKFDAPTGLPHNRAAYS